ncbi:methyltransferase domain-containing protein [Candidatus Woesearchaeota archaeon]|nr:methyltransferase domain-containing protein [Candidatus Woesearchaeota archaeon]
MNKTSGFWYTLFDFPAVYNSVRYFLLGGKKKMFSAIQEAVALEDGESLLDVGCGPGELSQLFGSAYAGLDYSQRYVDYASKKYAGKKFFQGNVLDYSLQEKSYDIVLLASFIHHFSDEEVDFVLKNAARVARKRVVLLEPCPTGNIFGKFLLKMDRGAHVRSVLRQKEFIEKYFQDVKVKEFSSGLYNLSLLRAEVA